MLYSLSVNFDVPVTVLMRELLLFSLRNTLDRTHSGH